MYELEQRIATRGEIAQPELHFMYTDPVVQLPVIHHGEIEIYEWGNRGNKESRLPRTGWCRQESLEAGKWRWKKVCGSRSSTVSGASWCMTNKTGRTST